MPGRSGVAGAGLDRRDAAGHDLGGGRAVWGPVFTEPVAKTLAWAAESLRVFGELAKDPATGVRMAPALTVGDLPVDAALPPQVALIPDLRPADPAEIPEGFPAGFRSTLPMIDMPTTSTT
ncbi:putative d-amino acid oxidase [Mycobacterium kansasii]|uniref:Putative d-amino acid oxidase n=1 Tax=Mycobacterium kansasii TaxID=1768 RepID=A0A1V3X3D5_MYCKA|nr:putative d-amino acid oxidase [Mycobacterium kansasii]